jgi:hypothetical protein
MASDPQKSMYMVKFLFADASFLEESFTADVTVSDAKQKLISIWPAGNKTHHLHSDHAVVVSHLISFHFQDSDFFNVLSMARKRSDL